MRKKKTGIRSKILACETVIKEMLPLLPQECEYRTLESGLHLYPEKLHNALQDLIDETTVETDMIILAFGLCANAVIGLRARASTLIIPRIDDCIGMFLGSREHYREQLRHEPGTYFLSKGWIEAGITLVDEFKEMEARFGKKQAEKVQRAMLKNYTRLAYIDMGHDDQETYYDFARKSAQQLNLRYDEIKGTTELLKKMIHGPHENGFVMCPPGTAVRHEDFGIM
ncbi:MAG: hypothetical protein A2Y65_04765 [Deltaproteobacteria bacterium RBG_13_52_11]|nr:MAG: hypothetical protein A2Y65_04765 [Deltaproteobacteria bacterium RBG_13_52_11]